MLIPNSSVSPKRTPLDSAAGKQRRESLGVVVAALRPRGIGPGRAAELRADGDQRLVEQPTLLQVLKEPAIARSTRRALGR